jgi:hypothetical protein
VLLVLLISVPCRVVPGNAKYTVRPETVAKSFSDATGRENHVGSRY